MTVTIMVGDVREQLRKLPDNSVHCVVSSPPYWGLRDYGVDGQLGLEATPAEFIATMVAVFEEVRRVLRPDGTCFINMGDSYWSGAQRAASCGTSGKVPADSIDHGCLCGNLCDGCRKASRIGKFHTGSRLAAMPEPLQSESSRGHTVSVTDRFPTLDSSLQAAHTEAAILGQPSSSGLGDVPLRAAPASTNQGFSLPPPASCLPIQRRADECLSCGCSLPDCDPEFSHTVACNFCIAERASVSGTVGKDALGLASGHSTSAALKPKDLVMMPHRLAIALQDAGWWVRQDIVWSKPNPMPESVTDRCTKSHEYIFFLTKSAKYYYDAEAIKEPAQTWSGQAAVFDRTGPVSEHVLPGQSAAQHRQRLPGNVNPPKGQVAYENGDDSHRTKAGLLAYAEKQRSIKIKVPGGWDTDAGAHGTIHREGRNEAEYKEYVPSEKRNKRSVWTMATHSFKDAHFATFPPELPETCIKAGSSQHGACSVCGTPWRRDTESTFVPQSDVSEEKGVRGAGDQKPLDASNHRDGFPRGNTNVETIGWSQACKCVGAHVVPCTVLDPFFGAGTTGLVADRLQRHCIGIELNPAYAEMARKRILSESTLFADIIMA